MTTYFDTMFPHVEPLLDAVFSDIAGYRPGGDVAQEFSVTASIRSLDTANDGERDIPVQWVGFAVELYVSELLLAGQPWTPTGGDEISFSMPDGSIKVYKVAAGPNGKAFEPLDTIDRKILVFCKLIRTEA